MKRLGLYPRTHLTIPYPITSSRHHQIGSHKIGHAKVPLPLLRDADRVGGRGWPLVRTEFSFSGTPRNNDQEPFLCDRPH